MSYRPPKKPTLALDSRIVQDNAPLEVVPKLYIGSIHSSFNQEALADLGVSHILNCSRFPPTFPKQFTYLCVDIKDRDDSNLLSCIPAANIFIEAGMDAGGVLVHCVGGRSRSAAFIAGFLMSSLGWSYDQTLSALRDVRPVVSINKGFEIQLRAYHATQFDIYTAQQVLLRCRILAVQKLRGNKTLCSVQSSSKVQRSRSLSSEEISVGNIGGKSIVLSSNSISRPISRQSSIQVGSNDQVGQSSSCAGHKRSFGESKSDMLTDNDGDDCPSGSLTSRSNKVECKNGIPDSDSASSLIGSIEYIQSAGGNPPISPSNNSDSNAKASKIISPYQLKMKELVPLIDPKTPYIRLSRPGSSAIRIIPPLRGMDRGFCCSWCGVGLFSSASILRVDINVETYLEDLFPMMQADAKSASTNLESQGLFPITLTSSVPSSPRNSNGNGNQVVMTPRNGKSNASGFENGSSNNNVNTDMGPPTPRTSSSSGSGKSFVFPTSSATYSFCPSPESSFSGVHPPSCPPSTRNRGSKTFDFDSSPGQSSFNAEEKNTESRRLPSFQEKDECKDDSNNANNWNGNTDVESMEWRNSDDGMMAGFTKEDSWNSSKTRNRDELRLPLGNVGGSSNSVGPSSGFIGSPLSTKGLLSSSSSALSSSSSTSTFLHSQLHITSNVGGNVNSMASENSNGSTSSSSSSLASTTSSSTTSSPSSSPIEESPRIPIPPHRLQEGWSPRDRPHSVERRRWLARVNLLHDGEKQHKMDKLAEDDEEALRQAFGREKYLFVEYLDWMGPDVFRFDIDIGEIMCYNCRRVIGSWTWKPLPRQSLDGRLSPPLFRIHKHVVHQSDLPLDATPSSTPRLEDMEAFTNPNLINAVNSAFS